MKENAVRTKMQWNFALRGINSINVHAAQMVWQTVARGGLLKSPCSLSNKRKCILFHAILLS